MRQYGIAIAVFGLFAVGVVAQEAVTIKITRPKAGDRIKVTKTEKTKTTVTFTAGGKTQSKDDNVTKTIVYVDEIVTAADGAGKPNKLKRTYEKHEVSKGGKDEPAPPLNTAILIEKKGDKYNFTADGKPVDAKVATILSAEFDKGKGPSAEDLLPGKAVKPGDTWKVDGTKIAGAIGAGADAVIDTDATAVNGKLIRTYMKDGKKYGVVELTGDVVLKGLGEKSPVKLKPGSKFGLKMNVDACIDGTDPGAKTEGTFLVKLDGEGFGVTLAITGDGTFTSVEELLKK